MPLYEYRCEACEHQFEVIQKFSDARIAVCPKCASGPVVKLLSSPALACCHHSVACYGAGGSARA